jgi:hypothetical protein
MIIKKKNQCEILNMPLKPRLRFFKKNSKGIGVIKIFMVNGNLGMALEQS